MLVVENEMLQMEVPAAYREGQIEIGGKVYTEAVCFQNGRVCATEARSWKEMRAEDFLCLPDASENKPELIIVGTGAVFGHLPPKVLAAVFDAGVGIECMNTASACITLTLLLGEGRDVWAWLWP